MRVPDLLLKAARDYDTRPRRYQYVNLGMARDEAKLNEIMNNRRAAGWHFEGSVYDPENGCRMIFSRLEDDSAPEQL